MDLPQRITRVNKYDEAGFWKRIAITWMIPLFNLGFRKDLVPEDLFTCTVEDDPQKHAEALQRQWDKELAKRKEKPNYKPSIARAIMRTFGPRFCLTSPLIIAVDAGLRLVQPIMIGRVVTYLSLAEGDPNRTSYEEAVICATGIVVTNFILTVSLHHGIAFNSRHGNNVRAAMTHLIYRKVLRLSMSSFTQTDIGKILNILASDMNRFDELGYLLPYILAGPLASVIALAVTYNLMGHSSVSGFIILILFVPFQGIMGRLFNRFRRQTTQVTDKRVNMMTQIVSAMRLIKVYCWEQPYAVMINAIRGKEIATVSRTYLLQGVNSSISFVSLKVILFACFASYVLDGNLLSPEVVFVTMSMYNVIRIPVTVFFPNAVGLGSEALVALKRITDVLLLEEKPAPQQDETAKASLEEGGHVSFENYSGRWTKDMTVDNLSNITCNVLPGELMIVAGSVGSGKTCFLYSILDEIVHTSGSRRVRGSISYASQSNWCIGATVKQNILMGSEFDPVRYKKVIKACGLERDLELFEQGDEQFVGEKGFNLSGGQKARVTLARAVYRDSDIYLFDDPLSAVDPQIANHIFNKCIKGKLLRDKIVILVTHQLQFLSKAEKVMILKQGNMLTFGLYSELLSSRSEFISFLDEKRKEEEEQKESLSRKASLSLDRPLSVEEEVPPVVIAEEMMTPESKSLEESSRQEVTTKGAVSFRVFWGYFRSGGSILLILGCLVFSLGSQAVYHFTDMWLSAWTQQEISKVEGENATAGSQNSLAYSTVYQDNGKNVTFYALLVIVLFIGAFVRMLMSFCLSLRCSTRLHNMIFRRLLRAPMQFFEINAAGRILNRFTRDMGIVDVLIPRSLAELNLAVLNVLGIVAVSVIVNWWLLIPTIALAALCYPIRMYNVRTSRDLNRLDATFQSHVYQKLTETFDGLITIRAFKLEHMCERQFLRYLRDSVACRFLVYYAMRCQGMGFDFFSNIYIACICIVLIVSPTGTIAGGDAGLLLSQSLLLMGLFQYCIRMTSELENQMTSAERVLEYAALPSEAEWRTKEAIVDSDWPSEGDIRFEGVGLRYSADDVLKDLNFHIRAGEKVGIVGRTGAGKSSLIAVLFRLVEPSGTIRIDGVETRTLGLHDLRQKISIIPQDPSLFSGSVRQNLDPFKEYEDKDLWSALQEAHLSTAIQVMDGLDAHVKEGGSNLSVGQRQLLCMARALLKKNRILVMDEATANVDQETDELIQRTIKSTFRDNTVLTIAHRLNTIIEMDKVLVMDAGRVVEFDSPYSLLQDVTGVFSSMVKHTGPEISKMLHTMAEESYSSKHRGEQ